MSLWRFEYCHAMAYDLTDLELFLQVVDRGSITQGAERAHLSLASASARITAMEKALGAKLLDRHRRGVVPSPTGWLLVAHARAIVGQLAGMRTELARAADGLQPTLVVLANTSATQTLLPTGLADFLATHSDIDVELQERPSHDLGAPVGDGHDDLMARALLTRSANFGAFGSYEGLQAKIRIVTRHRSQL